MCTLILATRHFLDTPLLIAANRDERLDRLAAPPEIRFQPPLLAPLDQAGSGTWLGLNTHGVFAGITNRFGDPPDASRRTRGLLVPEVLSCRTAREALDCVLQVNVGDFNRFHLAFADRGGAFLAWSDGEKLHTSELGAGLHVITERSLRQEPPARETFLRGRLEAFPRETAPDAAALRALLTIHAPDPFEGTCVHAPAWNYGTRSSTLIWLGGSQGAVKFLHADGPPCQTDYQDFSRAAAEFQSGAVV